MAAHAAHSVTGRQHYFQVSVAAAQFSEEQLSED
jgi:hypothetical protein